MVAPSEPGPSWAIGQARYPVSDTMVSALRERPDGDPMRAEVAQVLSTLGGQILAEGAQAVVYRTLAPREPDRYGPDFATALKNCAVLGDRLGRPREAGEHAHTAADWFGRSSERGGPEDEARAAMLLLEARSWLAAGAYARADRPASDAQKVYRRLLDTDPKRWGGAHQTALSLVELARSGAN